MAYPVVSVRSRVLPEEPQAPSFFEAGAQALLGVLDRQRAERREEEMLAGDRAHARSMVQLQDQLARERDQEQFTRERPFMETPTERRAGEREMLEFGSGMRRQEAAFDQSLRAPFEQWQRNFQERQFSYQTLRDQLSHNLALAEQERLQRESDARMRAAGGGGPGGTGAAGAGGSAIPPSLWGTLFSSEAIDPTDLYGDRDTRQGLMTLDYYLRHGRFPVFQDPNAVPGDELVTQPEGRGALGRFWELLTGGGPLSPEAARAAPAGGGGAILSPSGSGARQEVVGGAQEQGFSGSWFSRQDRDVVGSYGLLPNDVFQRMTVEDHVNFYNRVAAPEGEGAQYIERLFEVDSRVAEEVQRRVRGGG